MYEDDHSEQRFVETVSEHEGAILRVCLAFTDRRPENVRDMYQEIVYNLWKAFPAFRGGSKVSTWVYHVALNTAVSQSRRAAMLPPFIKLDEAHLDDLAEECRDELVEQLYELIDMLDVNDKRLIFMYLDKLPVHIISKEMNLSEFAVRQRIRRIKLKLIKYKNDGK